MNRESILTAIREIAERNGGRAPGVQQFENETGVTQGSWRGKLWPTWGAAVREAGLPANHMKAPFDTNHLSKCLAVLTKQFGRFPTYAEIKFQRSVDPSFPSHHVFNRLGKLGAKKSWQS
jgi:hypothetical protein